MSHQDYLNWAKKGRPFRLMQPAQDLRDLLRRYGYTVYDIGNQTHLDHNPPEDHTPYSATGYPGGAKFGIGYAIDIMPPTKAGLPSLQQLGARLLADRNGGVPGIKWLKYMNWEPQRNNGGQCYQESWKPNHARRSSTDRGHIHLSGLTGYETSTVGRGYDPVARIRGEDDMPTAKEIAEAVWEHPLQAQLDKPSQAGVLLANGFRRMVIVDYATRKDGLDEAAIVDGVLAGLAGLTPAAIAAAIPAEMAKQVADELVARLAS